MSERVGPVLSTEDGIPRTIRRQQRSALNVPLIWSAAEGHRGCAVLQWLISKAQQVPSVCVAGEEVSGRKPVLTGRDACSPQRHAQSGHCVQGKIARGGSTIKDFHVLVGCPSQRESAGAHAESRHFLGLPRERHRGLARPFCTAASHMRFRVLQSFLHHLRGRFKHARCAVEARHQAVRAGDRVMELRAWKLFCLLPEWLLQRPQGQSRVLSCAIVSTSLEKVNGAQPRRSLSISNQVGFQATGQPRTEFGGEGT